MNNILLIFTLAWLSNMIAWAHYYIQVFKQKYKLTPDWLNCSKCVGFWIGVITSIVMYDTPYIAVLMPFLVSLSAALIEKKLNS